MNKPQPTNFYSETYTPVRAHALDHTGSGRTFHYDNNGNITNDGTRDIIYNYDNMPTTVGNVSLTYDGNGSRVIKNSPGATILYVDKFYECTNGDCVNYIFAGNQRIALKSSIQTLYYHPDHQGSTSVVTDLNGNNYEEVSYFPFGQTRQKSGPATVSHLFTGQELDYETNLYNYNARLYDPDLGRFLTPDAIVPDPSNPQSLNRYSYAQNNPTNLTDPSGRCPICFIAVGAIIGAVSSGIQNDWNLEATLMGAGIGAASGAVFNVAGTYATSQITSLTGSIAAGEIGGAVIGGAAAGATASAISGYDVGEGAGFGALSGAAFGIIGSHWGQKWDPWRVGAATLAGGGLSAAAGGDFQTGALFAFGASTAAYAYNRVVRYGADWNPGGNAVNKKWDTYPEKGANNIRIQGGPVDPDGWFNEGGRISRFLNQIPGVNAVSGMHDVFQVTLDRWGGEWARNILNVPGVIPAAGITYGALMTDMRAAALYNIMSTRGRTR